jgi:hypothetical protein
MKKVQRFVVWICKHFNREQILNIVDDFTLNCKAVKYE